MEELIGFPVSFHLDLSDPLPHDGRVPVSSGGNSADRSTDGSLCTGCGSCAGIVIADKPAAGGEASAAVTAGHTRRTPTWVPGRRCGNNSGETGSTLSAGGYDEEERMPPPSPSARVSTGGSQCATVVSVGGDSSTGGDGDGGHAHGSDALDSDPEDPHGDGGGGPMEHAGREATLRALVVDLRRENERLAASLAAARAAADGATAATAAAAAAAAAAAPARVVATTATAPCRKCERRRARRAGTVAAGGPPLGAPRTAAAEALPPPPRSAAAAAAAAVAAVAATATAAAAAATRAAGAGTVAAGAPKNPVSTRVRRVLSPDGSWQPRMARTASAPGSAGRTLADGGKLGGPEAAAPQARSLLWGEPSVRPTWKL